MAQEINVKEVALLEALTVAVKTALSNNISARRVNDIMNSAKADVATAPFKDYQEEEQYCEKVCNKQDGVLQKLGVKGDDVDTDALLEIANDLVE